MKFTNRFNIPDIILRAAIRQNAKYDRGPVDRSVTQLVQPPRIDILRKAHFQEMEKDISDEWWALFGSAVHHILEMGADPDETVEQRFFATVAGWSVSGQCDLQKHHDAFEVSLTDYKVTTAFVVMKDEDGVKPEWEQQLNMLAYLLRVNASVVIRELSILAIVRDWQRAQAQVDPLYPAAPIVKLVMPLWSKSKQAAFMKSRIDAHRHAEMLVELGDPLPECTDDERWQRDSKWAVKKPQNKKATKVFGSQEAAEKFAAEKTTKKDNYVVEYRPGESVRCKGNYCGVAPWCDQWARIKEAYNGEPEVHADDGEGGGGEG